MNAILFQIYTLDFFVLFYFLFVIKSKEHTSDPCKILRRRIIIETLDEPKYRFELIFENLIEKGWRDPNLDSYHIKSILSKNVS